MIGGLRLDAMLQPVNMGREAMDQRDDVAFERWGNFSLTSHPDGVAVLVFDRPPVNAVSVEVYEDLVRIADRIDADVRIKAVVLTAPETSRAWCGGADLNDFVGMDPDKRKARYEFVNAALPRFAAIERPVLAAINGPVVGVGMLLVGLCDLRIASSVANFSCPEIDYGLVAGGGGILALAKMPEAKVREMLFTGSRFTAAQLEPTGYFNYVVSRDEVFGKAMGLARHIATKSLSAIVARKKACLKTEGVTWAEAYLTAQALSGTLAGGKEGAEGVSAFLEKRPARGEGM